jgi:hypothetical protein
LRSGLAFTHTLWPVSTFLIVQNNLIFTASFCGRFKMGVESSLESFSLFLQEKRSVVISGKEEGSRTLAPSPSKCCSMKFTEKREGDVVMWE